VGVESAADPSRSEFAVEVFGYPKDARSFRLRVVDAGGKEMVNDTQPLGEDAPTQWDDVPHVPGGSYWIAWNPGGADSRFDPFTATPRSRMPC
jgi:hypothetical protein